MPCPWYAGSTPMVCTSYSNGGLRPNLRDARVTDQPAGDARGHVMVVRAGQFAVERHRRPWVVTVEQLGFQLGAPLGIGGCQRADGHGLAAGGHRRAAKGLASGRRRYNATNGAGLSDQSDTAATSPAGVG